MFALWHNRRFRRISRQKLLLSMVLFLVSSILSACGTPSSGPLQTPRQSVLYVAYILSLQASRSSADPGTATTVIAALNANNGKKIWQRSIPDIHPSFYVSLTVAGSLLYATFSYTSSQSQVVALDAATGRILWRYTAGTGRLYPTIAANGALYMQMGQNTLLALDGRSGKLLWSVSTGDYILGQIAVTSTAVSFLQVKAVYDTPQPYYSVVIRSLHLSDGGEIWQKEIEHTSGQAGIDLQLLALQADNQAIYILKWETRQGQTSSQEIRTLLALHAQDGSPLWSINDLHDNPDFLGTRLKLFEGVLYVVGQYHMSFFNAQDGKLLRTNTTTYNLTYTTTFDPQTFAPNNYLYGGGQATGENFCSLKSSDGTKLWCSDIHADIGLIVVTKENVYLVGYRNSDQQQAIYVFSQRDGSQAGRYLVDDPARVQSIQSLAFGQHSAEQRVLQYSV